MRGHGARVRRPTAARRAVVARGHRARPTRPRPLESESWDVSVGRSLRTSSQSLGPLDPTLPLTHIELYYNQNDAVQVAGVTIQVGDTSYGLPASWSLENHPNGDGWLETDQSCVWWTKIYMEEL